MKNILIFYQDNAPAHTIVHVKQFLADSALSNFFLFFKVKIVLKRTHFESVGELKKTTAFVLKHMMETDFSSTSRKQDCISTSMQMGTILKASELIVKHVFTDLHIS